MGKYRNVPGTEITANQETFELIIIYKGFTYDYWVIDDYLWQTYQNETDPADWDEDDFNDWILHDLKFVYKVFENYHVNSIGQYVLI